VLFDQEIAEVILPESPQGVENISNETTVNKFIENGQLYIIKNNVRYNAQGAVVK
jgi:hypothetical protein